MATEPSAIQLTVEQMTLLGQFAVRTGKSREEVLTDALRVYEPAETPNLQPLASQGCDRVAAGLSLYERLARKGLIGCLTGGPPDLSTNPDYMEGFGESDR
jgi:hypothetical protein